ncbi:hypothetical protein EST38_g66 [Candolleomyces aberdarensis]|uniref:HTH APSES-type domain-containing protein n=1 Tax=Candolleomyces aberdarensis TaxID=2316362 RepID=A0A4Q2DYN5_9AGAR|nr:hypothetical protein EST38_g66 [Candolleomyces aberdarensis]
MPEAQIFKATYSGIPVYEMMCKGVAVMRRRSDSWLNATQILKVAGFDKPQRTRVLEREVQKGEHEKVQGGYGKYQGTWIPLERGLLLAKQYNCEHLLRAIIEFQPAAKSPPLAPKHLVASTANRPARKPSASELSAVVVGTRSSKRQVSEVGEESDRETMSIRGSEDGSMTPSPSEASSSSRTPSPIGSPGPSHGTNGRGDLQNPPHFRGRYIQPAEEQYEDMSEAGSNAVGDPRSYGDQILEYFISDTHQIPPVLIRPPSDFDPNMAIDDDGHTSLHWACAMGRVRIVKLLLSAGADIFKVNKAGQTALMRSVMFANNYDVRKFPELYELLHRSTLNIDNSNRTVFHHIVDVAMSKGKTHAARYYMETVLGRLADYPKELADVINFQDEDGETALTMAARCRSKRLVKLLIDHGADPKIANHDGKSAEDYILEDERFRSSPAPPSRAPAMSYRNSHVAYPPPNAPPTYAFAPANHERPPLHHSVAAQRASTRCINDMASMLDSLAASFDQELRDKERDMAQAQALLTNIQAEILESQRTVSQLRTQAESLPQAKQKLQDLQQSLSEKMGKRYRLGWEKWVKDEEAREKTVRDAASGELTLTPVTATFQVEEDGEGEVLVNGEKMKGKRKAQSQQESINDLIALHSNMPADSAALHRMCESLRGEVNQYKKRRKVMFDELVTFQAETGTSGKMSEYRRLISAGCGGVEPAEVDQVLGMLLEHLKMSLKYFTRRTAIDATTTSPYLTNLNHLRTIPKSWLKRRSIYDPKLKSVRTPDRIRYWNIVPGDQVRVRGDKTNALHEVLSINRLSNRVFVKGASNSGDENKIAHTKNFHYSRCQLFVGNYEFPSSDGLGKDVVPVFAQRVAASRPQWNLLRGRFVWNRFASKTFPKIPWETGHVQIPWPKAERPTLAEPSNYDTQLEVVTKLTYEVPQIRQSLNGPLPRPPLEDEYLTALYNAGYNANFGNAAAPLEVYLEKELSNPHARAKKQQRWKARMANEKARLDEIIAEEKKHINGRTEREARAEAAFRWRQEIKDKQELQKKMRWKDRMADVNMIRKARQKVKKEERHRRKLTELVLADEPNQFVPKDV